MVPKKFKVTVRQAAGVFIAECEDLGCVGAGRECGIAMTNLRNVMATEFLRLKEACSYGNFEGIIEVVTI